MGDLMVANFAYVMLGKKKKKKKKKKKR